MECSPVCSRAWLILNSMGGSQSKPFHLWARDWSLTSCIQQCGNYCHSCMRPSTPFLLRKFLWLGHHVFLWKRQCRLTVIFFSLEIIWTFIKKWNKLGFFLFPRKNHVSSGFIPSFQMLLPSHIHTRTYKQKSITYILKLFIPPIFTHCRTLVKALNG